MTYRLVITTNRSSASQTRRETLAGTDYLVVPVVALVAGVVNGELVKAEEIHPLEWNGVPVPLGHPQAGGEFISNRSPEHEAYSPARFYNARLENNSLKGEIWINLAQAQAIGGDATEAVKRFESGQVVEVSTAYFRDVTEGAGTYNGKAYNGIATNLAPDHLAILLHETGACSIGDGCGAPRTNSLRVNQMDNADSVMIAFYPSAADAQALALAPGGLPDGSELTPASGLHVTLCLLGKIEEITQSGEAEALRALADFAGRMPIVRAEVGGVGRFNNADPSALFAIIDSTYLQDWRRSLIYWVEDYFNIRRDYGYMPHMTLAYVPAGQPVTLPELERREIVFDSVALSWGNKTTLFRLQGDVREVGDNEMTTNAKQRPGAWDFLKRMACKLGINLKSNEVEEPVNEKEKLVAALVANTRCKFSQEALGKMDEPTLKTLSESLAEPPATPAPAHSTGPGQEAPPPAAVETPAAGADPLASLRAEIAGLKETITGLTGQIQTNTSQEKAELVGRIVANQATFSEAELNGFELPMLRKLAGALTSADYSLRGLPLATNAGHDDGWEDYPEPQLNGAVQGGAK